MMISSIFEEGGCTIESWTGGDLAGASLPFVSGSWNEHELQNACHTEQIYKIIWTIAIQCFSLKLTTIDIIDHYQSPKISTIRSLHFYQPLHWRKQMTTRPSFNSAKDWLGQFSSFLVWSGKGYHLWMWSLWGNQQPFSCVLGHFWLGNNQPTNQPGDPSLLLTSEKAVLGKVSKKTYLFGTLSQTSDPTHPPRTFGTKS